MTDPKLRALVARMADELDYYRRLLMDDRRERHPLATEARAALAQPAPPAEGEAKNLAQVSDGYHTFAELYEHRHSLMLALMRAVPKLCWFSQRHADGELPFGSDEWFIAGAELSAGSITYHLPISMLSIARRTGSAELPAGRPWDGHTASDVIQRLQTWADAAPAQPAPPADGEVAELALYLRRVAAQNPMGIADERLNRAAYLLERLLLPPGYIDPEHVGREREMLEVFYSACRSEGGTADEITLRGLRAVLARWGAAHA